MKNHILKIGPNEKCPCGSEKKYKQCCKERKDDISYTNISFFDKRLKNIKQPIIRECHHPENANCKGHIVSAHSLQKNGILRRIATESDGTVVAPLHDGTELTGKCIHKGIASTFYGFCEYHDKITFQPIEDYPFSATDEQIFLFMYRAFMLEYHKKMERLKSIQNRFKIKPSMVSDYFFMSEYRGVQSALGRANIVKQGYDDILVCRDYSKINYNIWTINSLIKFASTSWFCIDYDINNKIINPKLDKEISVTVFPDKHLSYCIFSWDKNHDNAYLGLINQFNSLTEQNKKLYLSNLLPRYTENFYLSVSMWSRWSESQKNALINYFSFTQNFPNYPIRQLDDNGFNLFIT